MLDTIPGIEVLKMPESDDIIQISILAGATALGIVSLFVASDATQTILTMVVAVYTLVAGFYWGRRVGTP
jgi:hypothetical protein